MQEVRRDLVRCRVSRLLPEEGVDVAGLAKDHVIADVKRLDKGLEVDKPVSQLQVHVGDHASWIGIGNEEFGNVIGPVEAPHERLAEGPFLERELGSRKQGKIGALAGCVMVSLCQREQGNKLRDVG